jgi:hypothetical protein
MVIEANGSWNKNQGGGTPTIKKSGLLRYLLIINFICKYLKVENYFLSKKIILFEF